MGGPPAGPACPPGLPACLPGLPACLLWCSAALDTPLPRLYVSPPGTNTRMVPHVQDDDIPGIVRYRTYEVLAAEANNPRLR